VGVDPNSVKVGEITLDDTVQAPYTAYLPVTVTGEGRFYFEGKITIEAPGGELFDNGESVWTEATNDFSVFAFEGKFFMGSSSGGGFNKAVAKILQQNDEYIALRDKRYEAENGTLKAQTFSDEEKSRLRQLEDQADKELRKRYYERYPIQPKPQQRIMQPQSFESAPNKGETVTLSVNWSANDSYASFLPVNGAAITIINNADGKEFASGVINSGKYSFVSPDNGERLANLRDMTTPTQRQHYMR
jgi:hypothetical protein